MVRSLVRTLLTTTAIVGAISGCGDGTAPSEFAGLYRLERYEGAALPAINRLTSADTMYVVSEQLWLTNGGDGAHAGTWRLVNAATPQGAPWSWTRRIRFSERAGRIEIVYPCPANADCIFTPTLIAERVPGGLAVSTDASSKPASIYARVR